jgi:tryptophan synthase alpha chain
MSRISERFAQLRRDRRTGLVTYITAGDPSLAHSAAILKALDATGVDVLEVGVPFSDPLADGPVIQRATERALASGTTLDGVLQMVTSIRADVSAPIVLFSYANPIVRMGLAAFTARAAEAGVDGVLVLDVPPEEGRDWHQALTDAGIDMIFLLSPTTSTERMRTAARLGRGFLYGISRLGVTGARADISESAAELAHRVRSVTSLPLALGFGVSTPEHMQAIGRLADAAVVGSALVQVIAEQGTDGDPAGAAATYVRWLRG